MHEFAIAQDIISSLEKNLPEDFAKITSIDIETGAFSGIVTDSLVFGLETIFADNRINNVEINIVKIEAKAVCECGNSYNLEDVFELCPKCGSAVRELNSGTEISVKSVNIKEDNNE